MVILWLAHCFSQKKILGKSKETHWEITTTIRRKSDGNHGKHMKIIGKPKEHNKKTERKQFANHRKTIGKPEENLRTTIGKPKENLW